jgi:uncharacterized protein YcfJ
MKPIATGVIGGIMAALAATSALAQTPYDDMTCRQFADQQTAGLRAQASNQAVGSTVGGALLGAGIGAAIGGGRGAAIGAGAGAVTGGAAGSANAQATNDYANQQYWAYYQQCMASRTPTAPAYPAQQQGGYPAQPGGYAQPYPAQPGYPPPQR